MPPFPIKLKHFIKAKSCSSNLTEKCPSNIQHFNQSSEDSYNSYKNIIENNDLSDCHVCYDSNYDKDNHNANIDSAKTSRLNYNFKVSNLQPFEAFRFAEVDDDDNLNILLRKGLAIDAKDGYGWSLLMIASCAGSEKVVKLLLEEEASTDIEDLKGNTAHSLASTKGYKSVVKMIETFGELKHKKKNQNIPAIKEELDVSMPNIYCDLCKTLIKYDSKKNHDCSICHLINLGPGNTHPSYSIPVSNKGYQLLLGQGWNSKNGLGPEGMGKLYPVKTALKRDKAGIGLKQINKNITHFNPGDLLAVKRIESSSTRNRKARFSKEQKDKLTEIAIRESLKDL